VLPLGPPGSARRTGPLRGNGVRCRAAHGAAERRGGAPAGTTTGRGRGAGAREPGAIRPRGPRVRSSAVLRVAVVGSGPSGCYAAQGLVQQDPGARVDVLDRLPCPYGLVRYGVAPDHEKIKSLQNSLRAVLEHDRVRFLGGVPVGPGGVPAARLRELYHAVVYCVGAATDRRLGVPGEDLPGSWSATEFVSWYSAHPDAPGRGADGDRAADGFLRGVRSAVVIGLGNVAVDVTRILARRAAE